MTFDYETFYARELNLAFGAYREDKNWRTRKLTLGQLIEQYFTTWKRGVKDGDAMTQGALIGTSRKSKAVRAQSLVMLDHDTGETMDEIAAAIEARGLYALLWTTYSHNKPESEITEGHLVQFLRKDPDWLRDRSPSFDDAVLTKQCVDYLKKIKKIAPAVFDCEVGVTKGLTERGMLYTVKHNPMARVRSLFVLDQPFDMAARGGTQDAAIDEWKDRYAGLSVSLGLPYDQSCVDPARLMYLPRIARDADEAQYEIREVEGHALTDDNMPRLSDLEKAAKQPKDALERAMQRLSGVAADGPAKQQATWKTKGLAAFLAKHSNDFEIEEFFEAHGLENRGPTTTGTCFECPTDHLHSDPGNPDDKGFWAQNASAREGGFACSCSHATCKTAAHTATGKVDRAWFLDEFCASHGLDVEALLEFCPSHMRDEDERVEEEVKTGGAIVDGIAALNDASPINEIMSVLELIAKTPQGLISDDHIKEVKRKTGHGLRTLRDQVTAFRIADAAAASGDGDGGGNFVGDQNPPPEDGKDAAVIWSHWGYSDMVRCVRQRLIAKNAENPAIFARPEGGYCRKAVVGERVVFRDIKESSDWVNIVNKFILFKKVATERAPEQEVEPFKPAITALNGDNDLDFGVIDRVVQVPVFNIDGGIRTTEGYDKRAGTWFHPTTTFHDVPDEVTPEDLQAALDILKELYIDFPFSDSYAGGDKLPIKTDELDADGHPVPNYKRGVSSRANTYAMLLLPFARSLIEGPCPVYFIDKPAAGTGAGYLADTLGYALYGHKMPAATVPENEDELRKQITATLREGDPAVFLDNLNHTLDSGALASALSTGVFSGRVLGQSEMVRIPIRSTWIIAANNGKLSHELMRRVVPIRLDAGVPNPAADRDPNSYKYDLGSFCRSNRDSIVWACHILIKNWIVNSQRKQCRKHVIQTFEEWSGVIGGILAAANIPGFLENVPAYLQERGEEVADEGGFIQRLYDRNREEWFSAGEAFDACLMMGTTDKIDPELGLDLNGRDEAGLRKSLGRKMSKLLGKTFRLTSSKLVSLDRRTLDGKSLYKLTPQ